MANPEHVEIVKRGKDAIAAWRAEHPTGELDLREVELTTPVVECAVSSR